MGGREGLERSLVLCANYFETHWTDENIVPVIICSTEDAKQGMKESFQRVLTLKEYVEGMDNNAELLDKISAYEHEMEGQGRMMFPEHLSYEQIQSGIKSGKYKKGNFQVSRENYTEALVHIGDENTWFIQGRLNCNRAVNGDIVAVELLPKEQWSFPQKII
ncbi:unnamed protein product, partial [Anisakis simplex]|uniref:Probable exosome complex exonuclease RRP44 (inferred by orthology to a C. elegans protein) n=1 Tax=Anisakis simplex TaxID=6269 RepID=A0A0M3KHV0_ANISI